MDSVATNTVKEESTHVSPQYDSSEEWEIGLGNLIIDLDADLEKDRQDGSGAGGGNGAGASVESSPLRIGKMKIKRKVSTNTATTPTKELTEGTSPRKPDNLLSGTNEEGCLSTAGRASPAAAMVKEEKGGKGGGHSVNSSMNASPHNKHDSNSSGKHTERNMTSTGSIPMTSGDIIQHGKYSSSSSAQDKDSPSVDNNICRIKTMDHKNLTNMCKKEAGGGKKKEEKEVKEKKGDGSTKKHGGKKRGNKASSNSIAVGTSDAETLTEPECLGPCEPGTSVNLEGIVWHETDQGVLVVNVTWRNKTYVGTLMDCTRHDWAPPRFCDSPTSDIENRNTKSCGRPKRGHTNNNSNNNNSDMSNFTKTRSSVHSKLRNSSNIKGRKGASANGNRTSPVDKPQGKRKHRPTEVGASFGEDSKLAKRLKSSNNAKQNKSAELPEPVPDANGLIECPEPNCSKKYKHINGLRYHRQHAHQEDKPDDNNEDDDQDNKSSSDESSGVSTPMESVKSKEWNDLNRSSDTSSNDTKATSATSALSVEQTAEKQRQQYSTVAAQAAATAAANAAAAAAKISSDKTSPKILHGKNSTPVKSKGEASEKTGGKPKKGSSTEKDLSVFDFNSTPDSDSVPEPLGSDKHVSIIRPIAVMSTSSPSKEPIATAAKLQDVIHTTALPGSEHLEDLQKHSKRSEKDKSKSGDRKKGKHDKVPSSKVKPTLPVTASPTPTPPQLGAVPPIMAAKSTVVMATTPPMKMPQTNGKQPVNPALKPMQQKPVVQSEGSTEKKKSKKKSKDKDKEREKTSSSAKDKESKESVVVNNKQNVQPQQQSSAVKQQLVAPTIALPVAVPPKQLTPQQPSGTVLPETNILHQALTQSGITPEDAERNSPSVAGAGDITKMDPSSQAPKDQSKDVRSLFPNRPPMHGNIPEIPKLISTSSVVNSAGRGVVPMQPHMHTSHPAKPLQPIQDNSKMDKSAVPMPQIKPGLLPETDANSQPPAAEQTDERARSPAAYCDISDANEDSEVPPSKPLNDRDPYSFQDAARNQAKVAPPSDEPHMHSKSLYTPLSEVGRDRVPNGIQKAQQDPHRTAAPAIHPPFKGDVGNTGGKEGSHSEGPDAKKPRKDSSSPRLPPSSEAAGYNRPLSQFYPGQYPPYTSPGFVMDPHHHLHLMKTDPHYRQQHEQFRQQQLAEKDRMERERNAKDNMPPAPSSSKPQEESKERTIPRIKTEPVTPPKRPVLTEKGQERSKPDRPPGAEKLKRKQLDFTNKSGSENLAAAAEGSERPPQEDVSSSKNLIHQQRQEEMRQYLLYQQKVQEQQEQRRKLEESRLNPESAGSQKEKENQTDRDKSRERHGSGAPSPSVQHNPQKNRSPSLPVDDRKHRGSPSASSPPPMGKDPKGVLSSSSSRKGMDYPSYLQHTPYGPVPMHQTPYGAIPVDPNHPAYQHPHVNPLIYQAYLGHGHYPGSVVSPMWKSGDEKGLEYEHSRATSPHQASSSHDASPSEPPPKALDLLQQHASRYYSSHKHDRSGSPADKSRPSSPQRRPASSRESPETSSASRERSEPTPMVQHHMHTHQHTHVEMEYPAVLPPYDPYVLASQQAAAAAATGVAPYPVRRDGMPP